MTSRDFCFWLQGFFELAGEVGTVDLTVAQTDLVRKHLALVFKHEIDPSMGPEAHQAALNKVHAATKKPKPEPTPEPSDGFGSGLSPMIRC